MRVFFRNRRRIIFQVLKNLLVTWRITFEHPRVRRNTMCETSSFKHWNKMFQALERNVSSRGLFLKHVSLCQPSTYHFNNNSYSLITSEVGKDLAYFRALFPDFPYFRFLCQFLDYPRSPINNGDYSENTVIPTFLSDSSGIDCVHPRGTSYSDGID